eukprot:jgi/Mesvir1/20523/Mv25338-RA.1
MTKTPVKVFVRLRPTANPSSGIAVQPDSNSVNVTVKKKDVSGVISSQTEGLSFKYDGIMQNIGQDAAFNQTSLDVIDAVLEGYNGTIFAYGQTGSGKTYTMGGDAGAYAQRGIIPRAISHVFREIDMQSNREIKVQVSYLEIYNEVMYDLLADNPSAADNLVVIEEDGATAVKNMVKKDAKSEEEALSIFFQGEVGRTTAVHYLNKASSRSHCVFTLYLQSTSGYDASEKVTVSKLHCVDLAGSERLKKTQASDPATLKEAMYINKSLTFLEQTVNSLAKGQQHVSFRQTKLTAVLKDALGGNCRTVMVACIWPEDTHIEETISTLRFAARVRSLSTNAVVNESHDPAILLRRYERQIAELKQELVMRDTFAGRGRVNYEDMTEAERSELNALLRKFLDGQVPLDDVPATSIKQVKEVYQQFKVIYAGARATAEEQYKKLYSTSRPSSRAPGAGQGPLDTAAMAAQPGATLVGDEDRDGDQGFHVGEAPEGARPEVSGEPSSPNFRDGGGNNGGLSPTFRGQLPAVTARGGAAAGAANAKAKEAGAVRAVGKNGAFVAFKREDPEGMQLEAAAHAAAEALREARGELREAGCAVNDCKKAIDNEKEALELKRAERLGGSDVVATPSGEAEIIDDEEFACLQRLKDAKNRYRKAYDSFKAVRARVEELSSEAADALQRLVDAFETWYNAKGGAAAAGVAGGGGAAASPRSPKPPVGRQRSFLDVGDDELEEFERLQITRAMVGGLPCLCCLLTTVLMLLAHYRAYAACSLPCLCCLLTTVLMLLAHYRAYAACTQCFSQQRRSGGYTIHSDGH